MQNAYLPASRRAAQPLRRGYSPRTRSSGYGVSRKLHAPPRPTGGSSTYSSSAATGSNDIQTTYLFEKLANPVHLREAFSQLKQGRTVAARRFRGAADRVSIELYEHNLDERLRRLAWKLGSGSYRPYPVNQFWQTKPSGGQRLLNVFTVEDRLVQRAVLNLIEPYWEPTFLECSFAFRPDRSLREALLQIEQAYSEGYRWAVDADIESFFDRIPRGQLLALLAQKIKDPRLMALQSLLLNFTPAFVPKPKITTGSNAQVELRPSTGHQPNTNSSRKPSVEAGVKPTNAKPQQKLGHLSRRVLENGLDWSIARLEGTESKLPPYTTYQTAGVNGWSSFAPGVWPDTFDDEVEDENEETLTEYSSMGRIPGAEPDPHGIYPPHPSADEKGWSKSALRRIGVDSTLLGLSLARKAVKHGLPHVVLPGQLGLVVKTGLALGAAGGAGAWALKRWRHQPTLYQVETAAYLGTANQDNQPEAATQWLAADPHGGVRGIAQGSILSPFYSNVYLHEFDRALTNRGYRLVRFADDLVILSRSQRDAFEALAVAERILAEMGLNFKPTKTRVCPLAEGFGFLGAELGPHGKWKKWPDVANLAVFPGVSEQLPAATGWLGRARKGWLRSTALHARPGPVQQGRPKKTLTVRDGTDRAASLKVGEGEVYEPPQPADDDW